MVPDLRNAALKVVLEEDLQKIKEKLLLTKGQEVSDEAVLQFLDPEISPYLQKYALPSLEPDLFPFEIKRALDLGKTTECFCAALKGSVEVPKFERSRLAELIGKEKEVQTLADAKEVRALDTGTRVHIIARSLLRYAWAAIMSAFMFSVALILICIAVILVIAPIVAIVAIVVIPMAYFAGIEIIIIFLLAGLVFPVSVFFALVPPLLAMHIVFELWYPNIHIFPEIGRSVLDKE